MRKWGVVHNVGAEAGIDHVQIHCDIFSCKNLIIHLFIYTQLFENLKSGEK